MPTNRPIYLLSPLPREGVNSLPMISFESVAERIDFSTCDTLMFSSKQAVVTADAIDKRWKTFPSIAVGSATKKQIELLGGEVIYHPKHFYGEQLAEDIELFFAQRSILYLRPEIITFDSRGFLAQRGITLHEQVIYKTSCVRYNPSEQPLESSIIIFTSPSTVHCFLENFTWLESYTAIVIGESTKTHLPDGAECIVAESPLIDACVEKAKSIANE